MNPAESGVVIDTSAYVHETVLMYGKVWIGPEVSMWPHAVIRSEMHEVRIGARSNVQDFVMIHVGYYTPTILGEDCSITHHATLHGCEIGDRTLIGINATIMDGAKLGANCVVAGHSIVRENSDFPDNSVIVGVPAKVVDTRNNSKANVDNAEFYRLNGKNYAQGIHRLSDEQLSGLFES
jgi:carbonic anhydrase/acetyltransferase-like protein (isoleucine patch superfamily)